MLVLTSLYRISRVLSSIDVAQSMALCNHLNAAALPRAAVARGGRATMQRTNMCLGRGRTSVSEPRSSCARPSLAAPFRVTHAARKGAHPKAVTPLRIVCANPRRVAKVQQQMRREISNMLQVDKVRIAASTLRVEAHHHAWYTTNQNPKPRQC